MILLYILAKNNNVKQRSKKLDGAKGLFAQSTGLPITPLSPFMVKHIGDALLINIVTVRFNLLPAQRHASLDAQILQRHQQVYEDG